MDKDTNNPSESLFSIQPNAEAMKLYSIFPAFVVGLNDGIHLCGLIVLLFFIFYLSRVGYTRKRIILSGLFFILSKGFFSLCLIFGIFDALLILSFVDKILFLGNFSLAALYLYIGLILFKDWFQFYRTKNTDEKKMGIRPAFLTPKEGSGGQMAKNQNQVTILKESLFIILLSTFLGFVMAVLGAIWDQNYYTFLVFRQIFIIKGRSFFGQSLSLYSIASLVPLMIIWILFWVAHEHKKTKKFVQNNLIRLKIFCSAIYIAIGIGVLLSLF